MQSGGSGGLTSTYFSPGLFAGEFDAGDLRNFGGKGTQIVFVEIVDVVMAGGAGNHFDFFVAVLDKIGDIVGRRVNINIFGQFGILRGHPLGALAGIT